MKRKAGSEQEISSGAMADIAFLLLIFFFIATTITEDEGLLVTLPPIDAPVVQTGSENVLHILVNADNRYMLDGKRVVLHDIKGRIKNFVLNTSGLERRSSNPRKAVVSIQTDRHTSYEAYIGLYNAVKTAYRELWDEVSLQDYGVSYDALNTIDQKKIRNRIPVVISEADPISYVDK